MSRNENYDPEFLKKEKKKTYVGISSKVTLAGTSLFSGTQYARTLSVGDQAKSLIPGILKLFLSNRPND